MGRTRGQASRGSGAGANLPLAKAMQEKRRSSAASPIPSGKQYRRHPRTRKQAEREE